MAEWNRVEELFHAALAQPPENRQEFLAHACPDDSLLRMEVQDLLRCADSSGDFLESSPLSPALSPLKVETGTMLGRYRVVQQIGAGAMGQVYRAHDDRLHRDVAIKVLPPGLSLDPDRLRRFEQEARTAGGLSHANILAIYDIGVENGSPYVVSELLEGQTLRDALRAGPLPPRKALDVAIQTAHGLAAAHQKGIVHRDLKPENLFLTREGLVKILDFGLAKIMPARHRAEQTAATELLGTQPGTLLGTVAYMSPEQVRAEEVDTRSDIFSFGVVLYEMVSGSRPFSGGSAVEVMHGILRADPPDLTNLETPLDGIIRRCLAKEREKRFQTAQDLAYTLEASTSLSGRLAQTPPPLRRSGRGLWLGAAVVAAGMCAAALWVGWERGERAGREHIPEFQQITFRRGNISRARFTSDGQTVIYAAAWESRPTELFTLRLDGIESSPLGLDARDVSAISSSGEMIVNRSGGLLARVPLAGGAPKDIARDAVTAAWAPDGKGFALALARRGKYRVEYPPGKPLLETESIIGELRFSPQGDLLAAVEAPPQPAAERIIVTMDLNGKRTVLTAAGRGAVGIAWRPDGKEIWYSTSRSGAPHELYAVDLSGRVRLLTRIPGVLSLQDISRDGVVLAENDSRHLSLMCQPRGETRERDLSWLDTSVLDRITEDGKSLLFTEQGDGASVVYMRGVDGSPAVRIGEGRALGLSPDGGWVLAAQGVPPQLVLLPVGAASPRTLERGPADTIRDAAFHPDGERILFTGRIPGHNWQVFTQALSGGPPRPLGPEGMSLGPISPDGKWIAAPGSGMALYSLETGELRAVPMDEPGWRPIRWASTRNSLFVAKPLVRSVRIDRLDPFTGRHQFWKEVAPLEPDLIGPTPVRNLDITPDGNSYAYSYSRTMSTLYLIRGLR